MEYEFDPTLTPVAQNRYAEGMVGDGNAEYTPETEDEAEESSAATTEEKENKSREGSFAEQREKIRERFKREEQDLLRQQLNEKRLALERMRQEEVIDGETYKALLRNIAEQQNNTFFNQLDSSKKTLSSPIDKDKENVEVQIEVRENAFRELQKIARTYLQNNRAQVKLTPEERQAIETLAEANSPTLTLDRMSEIIKKADRGGLLKDLAADNFFAKGKEEENPITGESREARERTLDQYYPPSAEDLAEQLTLMEGPEWQTGGEKEIIMADGTIHWGNLLDWARERWLKWGHQFSPDSPQASAWNTVSFLSGLSSVDLTSWVLQDRYWRKKAVKLDRDGNPLKDASGHLIYEKTSTGRIKYETSPEYQNFRQAFLNEMFRFSKAHEHDVAVRLNRGSEDKMMEQLQGVMDQTIWMKDRDGLLAMWKLSASNEVIKEGPNKGMFQWMTVEGSNGPIEEGNLGKAHRQADYLYLKMAHIENVGDQNNIFHEGLGEKGKREFYRAMVQRNLMRLYGSETSVKNVLDKVQGAGLEGVDLTEIMFCRNKADFQTLFTKQASIKDTALEKYFNSGKAQGERIYQKVNPEQFQQVKEKFLRDLIQEALSLREKTLEKLTGMDSQGLRLTQEPGRIAFRSKEVWNLFNSMKENNDNGGNVSLLQEKARRNWERMQSLGLRFMDEIVPDPPGQQGEKWNSKPNDARKEVQRALNLFKRGTNSAPWISTVRGAIQDAAGEVNDLPKFDAEYAENFAYSKVYFMLSSGLNDTTATGTDASTKMLQFLGYRANNIFTGFGKNFVGSMQNLKGLKRLLLTPWEGLYGEKTDPVTGKKQKISLAKVLEYGFTDSTRGQKMPEIDAVQGVERTYADNHVYSALKVFKRFLKGPIFDFEKWIKIDIYNRVSISPDAFNEIENGVNKDIRYTYNQIGADFEELDDTFEINFVRKPGESTYGPELTFKRQKLKDKLFDKEVINMGMYDRRIMEGRWVNKRIGQKDANGEDMLKEYSRNIVFYLVAKEILEHELYNPDDSMYNSSIWGRTMVNAIEGLFASIPIELEESTIGLFNKHTKWKKKDSFANRKEFDKIRKMGNAGRVKLLAEDVRAQIAESGWKGGQGVTKKFFSYIFQDIWTFK